MDFHEAPKLDQKLRASIISSHRRALAYPLYRNYDLASKVWDDLLSTSLFSKSHLLGSISRLFSILDHGKYRAYNKAFIADIKKWVLHHLTEGEVKVISQKILATLSKIEKKHIGFDLVEVEMMAKEYQDEQDDI